MSTDPPPVRRAIAWTATDAGAAWAFRAALIASVPVFYVVGRRQWFVRDDWAFLVTRERMREAKGWDDWLLYPQDGHWLAVPVLLFKLVREVFGLGSYWPFLALALLSHVGAVVLARRVCLRVGVSAWTSTLVATVLLVLGAGTHNLVFAVQVCYSLSLVCFLGQLLLADHDGPVDRRDLAGGALGLVGVMTSGFAPIFAAGITVLLVLRRRWAALAVGVGPQAVVYLWWLVAWGNDAPNVVPLGNRALVPAFVVHGIDATFTALVVFASLSGVAILATLAALFGGPPWPARRVNFALAATLLVMFAAIGWQRVGFGVASAAESRYVHVAAIVIAPAFVLAVDRFGSWRPGLLAASRILIAGAIVTNLATLRDQSSVYADISGRERDVFELVAGSPRLSELPPDLVPVLNSPDVTVGDLPWLVQEGAIAPRPAATDAERELLDRIEAGQPWTP